MRKRILILGATGMLGHVLFRQYSKIADWDVYATFRAHKVNSGCFSPELNEHLLPGVNANNFNEIIQVFTEVKPDIVINCVALIGQAELARDILSAIEINAKLPHELALYCRKIGARLIHISSDVVFDGKRGMYTEQDKVNVSDVYGMTKYLGEVSYPNCVTIRTSIIGHELVRKIGLVEWFIAQSGKVRGFTKAIYSGFPTIELARIISDYILPNNDLSGVYHIASKPISKYDLLKLIARRYDKQVEIEPDDGVSLDRSLDSSRFCALTGYSSPSWEKLIAEMHADYCQNNN